MPKAVISFVRKVLRHALSKQHITDFFMVSVYSFTNLVEPRNAGGNGQLSLNASFLVEIARDCRLGRRDERRRPSVVCC